VKFGHAISGAFAKRQVQRPILFVIQYCPLIKRRNDIWRLRD